MRWVCVSQGYPIRSQKPERVDQMILEVSNTATSLLMRLSCVCATLHSSSLKTTDLEPRPRPSPRPFKCVSGFKRAVCRLPAHVQLWRIRMTVSGLKLNIGLNRDIRAMERVASAIFGL